VLLHHPHRSALCLPAMQLVNTLRANPSRGVVLDEPQQQKSWAEKHIVDVMEEHSTAAAQSSGLGVSVGWDWGIPGSSTAAVFALCL